MRRYLGLLAVQLRASLSIAMQYRVDFLVQGGISVFWASTAFIPLLVVFSDGRPAVAGWSFAEALVVLGWFTLLKGVLEGAIHPSLLEVVEHIRRGTLDFVLLKPADAQFLVSTAKFEPWRVTDVATGVALIAYAFHLLGRAPTPAALAVAGLMLVVAVLVLYSLWIVVIAAAFYFVKVDNLSYLFISVFDAARWPSSVFPRGLRLFFTVVIPLAVMTTFPAMALLGRLDIATAAAALAGAVAFAAVARVVWVASLARYTSASS